MVGDKPSEGTVYTIRAMKPARVVNGIPIIILYFQEIHREHFPGVGELGYWHTRFRSLEEKKRTTDISIFKKILDEVNLKEPARI